MLISESTIVSKIKPSILFLFRLFVLLISVLCRFVSLKHLIKFVYFIKALFPLIAKLIFACSSQLAFLLVFCYIFFLVLIWSFYYRGTFLHKKFNLINNCFNIAELSMIYELLNIFINFRILHSCKTSFRIHFLRYFTVRITGIIKILRYSWICWALA